MKTIASFIFFFTVSFAPFAQSTNNLYESYKTAFNNLKTLVEQNQPNTFKQAVFITENTYLYNALNYDTLNDAFYTLATLANSWAHNNHIQNYDAPDTQQMVLNRAVFQVIKDTLKIQQNDQIISLLPFQYNFDDYNGKQDWSNTFVSKLLATHKGNCHSLPYLYKIIADEIGAKCWLALAPNHMYIKNYSKRDGWFNTELTSGDFPIDAWLTTTGYISLKSIQSGLYCDTLSNQQSIALCAIDLAKCYEKETHNYYDGFILQCCELVLKYHPVNVQALLLKAETTKRIYEKQQKENNPKAQSTYAQMEQQYIHLYDLGYREMPEKMYKEWLLSLKNQKDKYSNKSVK